MELGRISIKSYNNWKIKTHGNFSIKSKSPSEFSYTFENLGCFYISIPKKISIHLDKATEGQQISSVIFSISGLRDVCKILNTLLSRKIHPGIERLNELEHKLKLCSKFYSGLKEEDFYDGIKESLSYLCKKVLEAGTCFLMLFYTFTDPDNENLFELSKLNSRKMKEYQVRLDLQDLSSTVIDLVKQNYSSKISRFLPENEKQIEKEKLKDILKELEKSKEYSNVLDGEIDTLKDNLQKTNAQLSTLSSEIEKLQLENKEEDKQELESKMLEYEELSNNDYEADLTKKTQELSESKSIIMQKEMELANMKFEKFNKYPTLVRDFSLSYRDKYTQSFNLISGLESSIYSLRYVWESSVKDIIEQGNLFKGEIQKRYDILKDSKPITEDEMEIEDYKKRFSEFESMCVTEKNSFTSALYTATHAILTSLSNKISQKISFLEPGTSSKLGDYLSEINETIELVKTNQIPSKDTEKILSLKEENCWDLEHVINNISLTPSDLACILFIYDNSESFKDTFKLNQSDLNVAYTSMTKFCSGGIRSMLNSKNLKEKGIKILNFAREILKSKQFETDSNDICVLLSTLTKYCESAVLNDLITDDDIDISSRFSEIGLTLNNTEIPKFVKQLANLKTYTNTKQIGDLYKYCFEKLKDILSNIQGKNIKKYSLALSHELLSKLTLDYGNFKTNTLSLLNDIDEIFILPEIPNVFNEQVYEEISKDIKDACMLYQKAYKSYSLFMLGFNPADNDVETWELSTDNNTLFLSELESILKKKLSFIENKIINLSSGLEKLLDCSYKISECKTCLDDTIRLWMNENVKKFHIKKSKKKYKTGQKLIKRIFQKNNLQPLEVSNNPFNQLQEFDKQIQESFDLKPNPDIPIVHNVDFNSLFLYTKSENFIKKSRKLQTKWESLFYIIQSLGIISENSISYLCKNLENHVTQPIWLDLNLNYIGTGLWDIKLLAYTLLSQGYLDMLQGGMAIENNNEINPEKLHTKILSHIKVNFKKYLEWILLFVNPTDQSKIKNLTAIYNQVKGKYAPKDIIKEASKTTKVSFDFYYAIKSRFKECYIVTYSLNYPNDTMILFIPFSQYIFMTDISTDPYFTCPSVIDKRLLFDFITVSRHKQTSAANVFLINVPGMIETCYIDGSSQMITIPCNGNPEGNYVAIKKYPTGSILDHGIVTGPNSNLTGIDNKQVYFLPLNQIGMLLGIVENPLYFYFDNCEFLFYSIYPTYELENPEKYIFTSSFSIDVPSILTTNPKSRSKNSEMIENVSKKGPIIKEWDFITKPSQRSYVYLLSKSTIQQSSNNPLPLGYSQDSTRIFTREKLGSNILINPETRVDPSLFGFNPKLITN